MKLRARPGSNEVRMQSELPSDRLKRVAASDLQVQSDALRYHTRVMSTIYQAFRSANASIRINFVCTARSTPRRGPSHQPARCRMRVSQGQHQCTSSVRTARLAM